MNKYLLKKAVVAALALTIGTGAMLPAKTEAGSILETLISGAVTYAAIDNQVKTLDGDGRQQFFGQMKEQYGVCEEPEANEQLERIMKRLTPVLEKYDPTVKEKPYQYFVNENKSFNAFCTLGHNISVNIGLFNALNYNEDEIAFVLGHELSHGTHKDPANGVKKQVGLTVLTSVVATSVGADGIGAALGVTIINNLGTAKGITLPMEKRADKDAFIYCSEAGYNVGAGAAVWQRIIDSTKEKKSETNVVNQLFNPNDHPTHVNRRNKYNETLYEYSNKKVKVDAETGMVMVNKQNIAIPAALEEMSALERAYLVAGNLAAVYHNKEYKQLHAYINEGEVYLGDKHILTVTDKDNGQQWVNSLNQANKKK